MKQIISMAAYWLLFITVTIAQPARAPLSEAKPETAGVSAQRLQRLDLFLQKYIDDRQFNGATAIIIRDGKIIYHKAFGYSDMEKKKAMQKDDIFRIASMTKPLISVGAMMLCEEGRFSLDDPISKYIPEFKDARVLDKYNPADTSYTTVPAKSEITVRQVMSQSSGIGYAQIGSAEANAIYFTSDSIGFVNDHLLGFGSVLVNKLHALCSGHAVSLQENVHLPQGFLFGPSFFNRRGTNFADAGNLAEFA